MTNPARFQSAVSSTRPRGARVIEAYSPKLGRRLHSFGEDVFRQWIRLEADPMVVAFCERPAYLGAGDEKRLADFWVRKADRELLLVLDAENQITSLAIGDIDLAVRTVQTVELAAARVWVGNWERILPVIGSCRQYIAQSLQNSILKFVAEPMPLARIEQEFVTGDPTLVRASVFRLLHQGKLQAPQLHTEPLSYLTFFQPGREGQ